MRRLFENPLYEKFDPVRQRQNLLDACSRYNARHSMVPFPEPWYPAPVWIDRIDLHLMWREGLLRDRWRVTFGQFLYFMRWGQLSGKPYGCGPRRLDTAWEIERAHERHGQYREGRAYRRNPDHVKKEKTDRQIWREVSGIARDKREPY
jgi:hypothetical protein